MQLAAGDCGCCLRGGPNDVTLQAAAGCHRLPQEQPTFDMFWESHALLFEPPVSSRSKAELILTCSHEASSERTGISRRDMLAARSPTPVAGRASPTPL